MAQLFNPSTNTLSKASIFGAAFGVVGGLFLAAGLSRSPWATNQNVIRMQPVPFSLHELPQADVVRQSDARAGTGQLPVR